MSSLPVEIVITLTKKVNLNVDKYKIKDSDVIDFSNCDIYSAAQDQIDLDFKDWTVVEFDAFLDEDV